MPAYEDVLRWSATRPRWQQEALGRLIKDGHLTPEDVAELAELAVREASGEAVPVTSVEASDLAAQPTDSHVFLNAVSAVTNVNAILDGSRLEFAAEGVTVVYGANGSGKTGYVRILRKVVRARAPDSEIRPNVFVRGATPPSATIEYIAVDDVERFEWRPGAAAPDALSSITVFDRDCAAVYVTRENEVAYRPFGLDLLDRLATAVDNVEAHLQQRRRELRRTLAEPPAEIADQLRSQRRWPLTSASRLGQDAQEAQWTDEAAAELLRIDRALAADDPRARASAMRAVSRVLQTAAGRSRIATDIVDSLAPEAAAAVLAAHRAAEEARRLTVEALSTQAQVDGVGSEAWRELWETARAFSSTIVYPDRPFPATHPGSRCVLCHQELSNEAALRLQSFEAYVTTEAVDRASRAAAALEQARIQLETLAGSEATDRALLDDLNAADPARADVWEAYMRWLRSRARESLATLTGTTPEGQPGSRESPADEIERESERLAEEARVAAAAGDPVAASGLESRRTDLRTLQWLNINAAAIAEEESRLRQAGRLSRAIASCSTNAITAESNALTQRYVTRQLARSLADEAGRLGAGRVKVRMGSRGQHGATYHRIELAGTAVGGVRVDEVLSEGEFGAIALAAYLAELGQATHSSAIVLDDPVSSLDHVRRARIADRLTREARNRQVIVFTHDIVFLHEIQAAAERNGAEVNVRRLRRDLDAAGVPEDGLPWAAQKVRTRLGSLDAELGRVREGFASGNADEYGDTVRGFYLRLRDTWERAVEEVLFGDVVGRLRPDVKTQSATTNKVWLIEESDVVALEHAMTKVSAQLHDQPATLDQPPPEPDEVAADVADLRRWVEEIRQRRR